MKVVAYTPLHYGRDYLGWAIRSIIDAVDAYYVIYSPVGSHGHRTDIPCPETRAELYAIAQQAAGAKLHWHEGTFAYEGQQRDMINDLAPDADVILALDADEIWGEGLAENAIRWCAGGGYRKTRLPMVHFWRSFYRAVRHDPCYPVRVTAPKYPDGERTLTDSRVASNYSWLERPENGYWIAHMGYAQRPEIVEYKQHTHGHKSQWRQDDWFHTVFMANAQTNCHPVGSEYWNLEPVNPWDYLPAWMQEHPYANLEVIP